MSFQSTSNLDRALAAVCETCPACRHARKTQKGLVFELVKKVESKICPFCKAYERVYGRKSCHPLPSPDKCH
jgi:hypothetical protein